MVTDRDIVVFAVRHFLFYSLSSLVVAVTAGEEGPDPMTLNALTSMAYLVLALSPSRVTSILPSGNTLSTTAFTWLEPSALGGSCWNWGSSGSVKTLYCITAADDPSMAWWAGVVCSALGKVGVSAADGRLMEVKLYGRECPWWMKLQKRNPCGDERGTVILS